MLVKSTIFIAENSGVWFSVFSQFTLPNSSYLLVYLRGIFHLQKKPENFHRKFPFGKSVFHLSHVPFVHRPLSVASPNDQMPLVNCSAIISNTSFFVPFPPNKHLLSAYVVKRRLTSVSFHLPRCSGVETLPVNEELPKNFSQLFMQHFRRKMCTGKNNFERARISTYHSYIRHICAAINFLDLALELGRQSTRSSPESLFAKSFQKTDPDQPPYLLKHKRRLAA